MKFPSYGARLMEDRRTGRHPLAIHVVLANRFERGLQCDWFCDGSHPELVVTASEFSPGVFDWRCVTGSLVTIFDRANVAKLEADTFIALFREIALFAGPVWCETGDVPGFWPLCGSHDLTEAIERVNVERRKKWTVAAELWLGGRAEALT